MADKEDKEVKEEKKEEKPEAPKKNEEFQLNVPMEDDEGTFVWRKKYDRRENGKLVNGRLDSAD